MVRWMCNVKVKDRVPSKELRERLGIDDIILILQQKDCMMISMVGGLSVSSGTGSPGSPGQRAVKRLLLCCCCKNETCYLNQARC